MGAGRDPDDPQGDRDDAGRRPGLATPDGRAWMLVAALLAAGALGVAALGDAARTTLDWQPATLVAQPWRAWTAAWVHLGTTHLVANLGAVGLLALLGRRAGLGPRDATAWALAWPLTHALMSAAATAWPAGFGAWLPHVAGMSGVLHAGVAIAALSLAGRRDEPASVAASADADAPVHPEAAAPPYVEGPDPRRARLVGRMLLVGLAAKVIAESPWDLAPRLDAVLGIAVAPEVHLAGALAGAIAWALLRAGSRHPGDAVVTGR